MSEFTLAKILEVIEYCSDIHSDDLTILSHALTMLAFAKKGILTQDAIMEQATRLQELMTAEYVSEEQKKDMNNKIAELIKSGS